MPPTELDPNSTELTPPPTLNTETPPSSNLSVDTTGQELFLATLREKNQEIERLKAEAAHRNKEPRKTGDAAWSELTDDPRRVIAEEVAEAVRPIKEFVESMKVGNAFAGLKTQAAGMNPINAKVLEKCGGYVDNALSQAAPNLQNVVAAISLVIGLVAQGQIPNVTMADLTGTSTPTSVPPTSRTVPPTLSPSSSPLSKPTEVEKSKPWEHFSENELAMARFYKMTPENFWKKMQGDSIEVDPTKGRK